MAGGGGGGVQRPVVRVINLKGRASHGRMAREVACLCNVDPRKNEITGLELEKASYENLATAYMPTLSFRLIVSFILY
jgi:hypothetical protein